MSLPAPPSLFVRPPPIPPSSDAVTVWPIHNMQHPVPMSRAEFPPFKKPKIEEPLSNSIPNLISNPNMPPLRMPSPIPPAVRGVGKIFRKTRLCANHKAGICPYGSNCNFAHGVEDVRMPPDNWHQIVAANGDVRVVNWEEEQKMINRKRLCNRYYNGQDCPYGERCNYLHEDPSKFREELERSRECSAISIKTTGLPLESGSRSNQSHSMANSSCDSNQVNQKPSYWKTKICNKWETSGFCPFGEKCHFAHGVADLQKYGGPCEAEITNSGRGPSKALAKFSSDMFPSDTAIGTSSKPLGKKFLLKWKGPDKISRIYADWIDDLPIVQSSPSSVEK